MMEGDIRDTSICDRAMEGVDYVLHQAAIGSVPVSLSDPLLTHSVNVTGFLNVMTAGVKYRVKRVVYASSCAVYGDNPELPLSETSELRPLSPYAATKACNELYAKSYYLSFGLSSVGLRYFNVYGERQDPNGAYAAVIPRWATAILSGAPVCIFGDGLNTRDFVYVDNVVAANIAAALKDSTGLCDVYNVASGRSISLNELYATLIQKVQYGKNLPIPSKVDRREPRPGDIRYSSADISKSLGSLNLRPIGIESGIEKVCSWYSDHLR
jgi:UDP-N-acetylglucosamine 4-epimerase